MTMYNISGRIILCYGLLQISDKVTLSNRFSFTKLIKLVKLENTFNFMKSTLPEMRHIRNTQYG